MTILRSAIGGKTICALAGSLALALAVLAMDGVVSAPAQAAAQAEGNADKLLVVDCLLPGQIRRLGGVATYVSARKAIKTSAQDCEIRGGEYTAYDRASYATALKIWLPLAQEGKADAQTNVGEIFEKGLGVPPDFAAAAVWYKRAADQGFSRAAINLGGLYERGLGVPKDPVQALTWYRKAAGLNDLNFQIAPNAPAAPASPAAPAADPGAAKAQAEQKAEVERLRGEVQTLRRQLNAKQGELERTQRELDNLRQSLRQRSGEADSKRDELAQLRHELESKRQQEGANAAGLKELERSIADREKQLKAKDREVADLRASLAKIEKESRAQRTDLDKLRQKSASKAPSIQLIEPELVATRGKPSVKLPGGVDSLVLVGRVETIPGLISLTVNGREEKLDGEMFHSKIPVAEAEEHIRIVAVDRNGKKSTLEFIVPSRPSQTAAAGLSSRALKPGVATIGHPRPKDAITFGRYHALVIGNNNYKFIRPLKTAVEDATEIARILKAQYGFDVKLLLNADRYDILSALNELREKLTDKDNLLIYYAGHGELDQVNQRGNWLPVDAEPNSSANWISNISITDVLNAMTVRQLLVVADSCYSGTLTRSAVGHIEGGVGEDERLKLIRLMVQQRSRMALTAGGVEPVLDSVGGKHSAFAQAFIDLLSANIGVLPGQELFQALQSRVATAAEKVEARQVPEYAPIKFAGHESGDFFFVRTVN